MRDPYAARRELQLASIPDIQGSIQANDTKSSAALVVHGLLFAGIVTVIGNLGGTWDDATLGARISGGVLIIAAAIAFGRSVLALIEAAAPHDPESTRDAMVDMRVSEAFFPPADPRRRPPAGPDGLQEQLDRLSELNSDGAFEKEYAAEQVKLADIRVTQAHAAKKGFAWLRYEIFIAGLFLLLVALVAIGAEPLARPASGRVGAHWEVVQGAQKRELPGSAVTTVERAALVTLRLVGRGDEVERARLSGSLVTGCLDNGRPVTQTLEPVAAERSAEDGAGRFVVEFSAMSPCPVHQVPYAEGRISGEVTARGAISRSQLTLRRP